MSGRVHNPDMLPESPDDPLEQDAPDHHADDPAITSWFLAEGDRANSATDLRMFTTGNLVQPLIDGRGYFGRLCAELKATRAGDQVYLLDFRGDLPPMTRRGAGRTRFRYCVPTRRASAATRSRRMASGASHMLTGRRSHAPAAWST